MMNRLPRCTPACGPLRRLSVVAYRPQVVLPPLEVQRQFPRLLFCSLAITYFFTLADHTMKTHPPSWRHPAIQHRLVERVDEAVTPTHRAVRPVLCPGR